MTKQSLIEWYQAAVAASCRQQGKRVVELVAEGFLIDGFRPEPIRSADLWRKNFGDVVTITPQENDGVGSEQADHAAPSVGWAGDGKPIDLLYLDAWPIGTPQYKQRHRDAYRHARAMLHQWKEQGSSLDI